MAIFSHKGIHYHIAEWGDRDNPPLVLLHGFSQSSTTWEKVAPKLAKDHFVIAPDFIGHGNSDRPEEPISYEMDAVLDTLTGLLRWLWLDRVDLLGYSMGGRIALAYTCAHPHHVTRLVLESTGLGPQTEQERQAVRKRDSEMIEKLSTKDIESFMDEWENQAVFDSQKNLSPEMRSALRKERCANDPRALALTVRGTGQHTMPDFSQRIQDLPLPVLYIAGTFDHRYLTIAEKLQHSKGISCALLDAGHNTHVEAPDSFLRVVSAFLKESPLSLDVSRSQ